MNHTSQLTAVGTLLERMKDPECDDPCREDIVSALETAHACMHSDQITLFLREQTVEAQKLTINMLNDKISELKENHYV